MKSNKFCDPRNLFQLKRTLVHSPIQLKPETFTKPNVVALE
jgi:hypothetical protein